MKNYLKPNAYHMEDNDEAIASIFKFYRAYSDDDILAKDKSGKIRATVYDLIENRLCH